MASSVIYGDMLKEESLMKEDKLFFEFTNCSFSSALDQISKATGIEIFSNKDIGKVVLDKSYEDKTIEEIIEDLLKRENRSIFWYYNNKQLVSIGIWIFDGSGNVSKSRLAKFAAMREKELRGNIITKNSDSNEFTDLKEGQSLISDISSSYNPEFNASGQGKIMEVNQQTSVNVSPGVVPEIRNGFKKSGNSVSDAGMNGKENQASLSSVPLPPNPEKRHGLEPPPMPPGFYSMK